MISRRLPEHSSRWRLLVSLGDQLMRETSVIAQHNLIIASVERLLDCQVDLCFLRQVYHLPNDDTFPLYDPSQASRVMQLVFETQSPESIATSEKISYGYPLSSDDTFLAILEVNRPANKPLSPADSAYLSTITGYLASILLFTHQVAIKNFRLEQIALVRSVTSRIANILDLDELARQVTQLILDTFQYYYVGIFTIEPYKDELFFRASALSQEASASTEHPQTSFTVRLGEGIVGTVAKNGTEILASDVGREPLYRYIDALPETASELALPLKIENRVVGVLDVQSNGTNAFHEIDQLVLRSLADSIAYAVERARLYKGIQKRAEQLSTVAEISRIIASILDFDQMLDEVVNLIRERIGFPYVHIFTVHPGRRKIIYQAGSGLRDSILKARNLTYDLDDPSGMIPWVARQGKVLVANDVRQEPLYRDLELLPIDTQSELTIPLVYGSEVLGVLDIQSDQTNAFHEDDRFLLEALADNVSVALRNALLYRSEKWRRQVAESLRDVAGLLSSNAALDDVLDEILTELDRNLPCEVAAIWLLGDMAPPGFNTPHEDLTLAAVRGGDHEVIQRIRELTAIRDAGLAEALNHDGPVIRSPGDPSGPLGIALNYPPDYSSIVVPLRIGDKSVGILALAHPTAGRYGNEAQSMISAFAGYAAVAIENSRLYHSAQQQAWVSTVLLEVAEATQSLTTTDELLSTVVRLTPMLVGVKGCALFLWDSASETFTLNSAYGLDPAHETEFGKQPIRSGQALGFDEVRISKSPVFIQECGLELGFSSEITCQSNQNVFLLLPLLTRGELLGAFLIEHRGEIPTADEPEETAANDRERLAILQGIAQQTAIAVENIRLLESKQEEAYVTAVLLQVAQSVVSSNDLNDILASVVQIMPILVGIECNMIFLWDAWRERFHLAQANSGAWKLDADFLSRLYCPDDFPILKAVLESASLVVHPVGDLAPDQWPHLHPSTDPDDGQKRLHEKGDLLLAFPLLVKGELLGVLLAQESNADARFRERRVEIITGIAQQITLAIQNDRLNLEMVERERLEREFQLAREIQQTFLPSQLPRLGAWDIDVRWRTARQVGGDFYDVFKLPNRRLGLVIADVSDKGMPAALYMTVARTLIRATAHELESPAQVLNRVNDLLLMDSQYGMFVTAVYAIVSMDSGEITYAIAGHNLPLIQRSKTHLVEPLTKGGAALGVFETINLEDHLARLQVGDSLVFYTDGITEAFSSDNLQFGEDHLREVIGQSSAGNAFELGEAIDQALTAFTGDTPPSDDITLMILRRLNRSTRKQARKQPGKHQDDR